MISDLILLVVAMVRPEAPGQDDPPASAQAKISPDDPQLDPLPPLQVKTPVLPEDATRYLGPKGTLPRDSYPAVPGYRITALIARGGMGCVYAAYDMILEREVAIKTLLPGGDINRFVTEAQITARLPHPNIPPVYALGTLKNGDPWLAMKLIRGQTLAQLLQDRKSTSDELPRFLQVFEQVALAVGFAHSRNIIHRDVKPLNVMVGEFGDVQVMDWGLAKDVSGEPDLRRELTGGTTEPEGDGSGGEGTVPLTRAGMVMGTPGYMAPEQARGENVDARADVFALGSILATILTGKPAFVGTTAEETMTRAASADLTDVRNRLADCGADTELVQLTLRCLAARPEDRYSDAREVATAVAAHRATVEARLRQAETAAAQALVREAELRKRRRLTLQAAGLVAAVLLGGLSVSLWQMNRALTAEQLARANERQALANAELARANERQALVERDAKETALQAEKAAKQRALQSLRSLTDRVVERKFTQSSAQTLTDEEREFLRSVQQQWEGFAAVAGNDAESRAIRAEGLYRVGWLRHRLGELDNAEQNYADAVELWQQLVSEFPGRPQYRELLANSHNSLGSMLASSGRLQDGERHFSAALSLRKKLVAEFPTRGEYGLSLVRSHHNLGLLYRIAGRLPEAEQHFSAALALQQRLIAEFPNRPEYRAEMASCHNNMAGVLRSTGRLSEAEQHFTAALALQQRLIAEFPNRPEYRSELASCHNNLGLLLQALGRIKEAEGAYTRAIAVCKRLTADFPAVSEHQITLAAACCNLGHLLRETDRPEPSLAMYSEAIATLHAVLERRPKELMARHFLRNSHWGRAQSNDRLGRYDQAVADWNRALELAPEQTAIRLGRARSLARAGRAAEAVAEANKLRDLPTWDAHDLYNLACVYAVAAGLEADKKSEYAHSAMELLRRAVRNGWKDAGHARLNPDLNPLRDRDDFRTLLADLHAVGRLGSQPGVACSPARHRPRTRPVTARGETLSLYRTFRGTSLTPNGR